MVGVLGEDLAGPADEPGLTEARARGAGHDVVTTVKPLPATFRGWIHGPGNGGLVKLVVDRREDVLIGATAVGPAGGEVLGLLSLAVHARVPLRELRWMIYAFPTFHGAVGEALGAYARALQDVLDPGRPDPAEVIRTVQAAPRTTESSSPFEMGVLTPT